MILEDIIGGGIKSIQRGEVTGTATITINPVDTSKTSINSSFVSLGSSTQTFESQSTSTVSYYARGFGYGKVGGKCVLTNTTTLDVVTTDANTTVSWEVIEYA